MRSGNFQLSPDFRQRASSNASSVGRLSPIPSIIGIESDWYNTDFIADTDTANGNALQLSQQQQEQLEDLAGTLADELNLQGSVSSVITTHTMSLSFIISILTHHDVKKNKKSPHHPTVTRLRPVSP